MNDIKQLFPDLLPYFPEDYYQSGDWKVSRFNLSQDQIDFSLIRDAVRRRNETCGITPGTYLKLTYKNGIVMSNTPMERATNEEAVRMAHGNVLIGGLGLGWVTLAIQAKPEVKNIWVVELSKDVIKLVGKRLPLGPKVHVINWDVFSYTPPQKLDTIYIDIWSDVPNEDDRVDIELLHKHHGKFLKRNGWMGCWREDELLDKEELEFELEDEDDMNYNN